MKQHVCQNGNVIRIGVARTEVVLNSGNMVPGEPEYTPDQRQTAQSLGYGRNVVKMVEDHDPLHALLADWLGLESFALRVASGELPVGDPLADLEEDAVLAIQRFMVAAGGKLPGTWREL